MIIKWSNVLILSPHTDDSELGCGGFISHLIFKKSNITIMMFSNASKTLPTDLYSKDRLLYEFKNAAEVQGIYFVILNFPVRKFSKHRDSIRESLYFRKTQSAYDLILTPCTYDKHQDHQIITEEAQRVFKTSTILGYELPWNHVEFSSPLFINLDKNHICNKWIALSCYESQIKMERPYFNKEFIFSLAKVRGVQSGCEFAEMYQFIRGVF